MSDRLDQALAVLEELENAGGSFQGELGCDLQQILYDKGIRPAGELRSQLAEICREGRLLQVGIIGKVKAGKSSLLNALFFDGEQVLPQAATPMTASLTLLTWGETPEAKVDYFSAEDIEDIRRDHEEYERQSRESPDEGRKKDSAEGTGKTEIKISERLKASHEQFELMRKSGRLDEFRTGRQPETFAGEDTEDLVRRLQEYVGSDGPLMPFTRSVELRIPRDGLRDIAVVDTPGLNDPVVSRSERTTEYLGNCDVVFVICAAGQFLTAEDLALMTRLGTRQSIQEICLVGTKQDNLLPGLARECDWDLTKAIGKARSQLMDYARTVLEEASRSSSELAVLFEPLLRPGSDRVLLASALSDALRRHFHEKSSWTSDMKHHLKLLKEAFPDHMTGTQAVLATLEKLSGLSAIAGVFSEVRDRKEEILQKRRTELLGSTARNVNDCLDEALSLVQEKKHKVENSELGDVREEQEKLRRLKKRTENALNEAYESALDEYRQKVRASLAEVLRARFSVARDALTSAVDTETRVRRWKATRSVPVLFGLWSREVSEDRCENYDVKVLHSDAARGLIDMLSSEIRSDLETCLEEARLIFIRSAQEKVLAALQETMAGDPGTDLDMNAVRLALRGLIAGQQLSGLKLGDCRFRTSCRGKLEGDELSAFLDKAYDHMSSLRRQVESAGRDILSHAVSAGNAAGMADELFQQLDERLEELRRQVEDKENSLRRFDACLEALSRIEHV